MSDTQSAPPASDAAPPARRERRLKLLLIASLAVNLLVLGTVLGAGFAMRHHGPHMGFRGGDEFGLMRLTRTLPPERRDEIRKTLRTARKELRPMIVEIDKARDAAAKAMAVEPFDATRVKAAFDQITEREQALKQKGLTIFLEQAAKLTPEERKTLSELWQKRPRRPPPPAPDASDADGPPPPPPHDAP